MPVTAAGTGHPSRVRGAPSPSVELVVLGAHLSGHPLNPDLLARGARLLRAVHTAPTYRLWALDTVPRKPGLLRVAAGGASIAGELWELPVAAFGDFVATLPAPMTIGSIELVDASRRPGFLVEPAATAGALDITSYGGWRQFLASETGMSR